jgi:alpha-N-acetylglucosamine transferase
MLNKGILLIATGHPGYGKMAYNLALTIKAIEQMPIAIIYSDNSLSHLNEDQLKMFDFIIELPNDFRTGFGTKLHIDQLTPFDKTLFLDADMLWLGKKPSDLFNELSGVQFTCITEGDSDNINQKYYFWADIKEIKEAYKVEKVYQTRSEVIYFEKGTKVFKKARELKPESKLKTIRRFGESIPDELYFNIALAILKIETHTERWMPAYWNRLHNEIMPNLSVLFNNYFLLSFGSNVASPVMKRTYDNIMQVAANKLGLPYLFKLKSKKEWAPGRSKI